MEAIIKNELHDAVFLYGGFWDDFLPGIDDAIYDQVKMQVNSSLLKFEDPRWSFDYTRFAQRDEDAPLAGFLNAIGQAVHATHPGGVQDQFRPEYRPFSEHGNTCTKGDYPNDTRTKPNLVTAERNWNHDAPWGDVEMVVECQPLSDQDSQNEALFQLARCAYAIFSGQIFRLHVFGVAICGSTATFVRFDRSGLLHSPDIDISTGEGADLFVQKMISLLVLPAKDFGYDPRYTFRRNDQRHLETLFAMDGHPPRVVSDLLCHRKCCRGRATLASCLAVATTDYQVPLSAAGSTSAQRFLDRDVVHKKIWRKEDRTGEGTTLERFRGVFAVCQVIDFQDEVYDTRLQYPNLLDQSPAASRFIPTVVPSSPTHTETSTYTTTSTTESNEGSDTKPIGELALIANDENTKTKPSQSEQPSNPTPECKDQDEPVPSPTYPPRETRFESDLLMPNGRPLLGAQSALHVLYAMHDVLLGIMAFDEAGMLHRDISAYNILLINPEVHYRGTDRKWNNTVEGSLGNLVWKCLSSKPLPDVVSNATDTEIADSGRSWREEYIDGLSRGPYAVICDAEHAVKERRPLEEVHRDRTGTPTFVSAQLLLNPIGRAPVYRSFVHDLESLMWVLVWVTIHQDIENMSEKARQFARDLSLRDLRALGEFKRSTIQRYLALRQTITEFGNPWSKQLAPTIQTMARFFADFLYPNEDPNIESSDNQVFAPLEFQFRYPDFERPDPRAQIGRDEHLLRMKEDRLRTFQYFLELFGCSIASLSPGVEEVDIERV